VKTEKRASVRSCDLLSVLRVASPRTLASIIGDVDLFGKGADREALAIRAAAEKALRENVGDEDAERILAADA
jgi:hypothetical protein